MKIEITGDRKMLKLIKRFDLQAVINSEEIKVSDNNERELLVINVDRRTITFIDNVELTLTFIKELMEVLEKLV